ncbi:MAG: helix-turn-helix domain-containing protein [Chloroflexi bacterium]|nr:helix-turn-helix domain-containing protein [Chloroflexota bacterium]
MAILSATDLGRLMPVADAAQRLGLSQQRVRALVADGELPARKSAGRWFVERSAVEKRIREPRLAGRPFSPEHAWGLVALAEGEPAPWLDASNRSRLRRQLRDHDMRELLPALRRRARRVELRAHPSDLARLAKEPDLVWGGVSAAAEHRLEIVAPGNFEAYVSKRMDRELQREYNLKPSTEPNVVLHVVDGPWPFDKQRRVVPLLVAVLDLLEDDDERARRAASKALQRYRPSKA